jgi:hypothetical protein
VVIVESSSLIAYAYGRLGCLGVSVAAFLGECSQAQ